MRVRYPSRLGSIPTYRERKVRAVKPVSMDAIDLRGHFATGCPTLMPEPAAHESLWIASLMAWRLIHARQQGYCC